MWRTTLLFLLGAPLLNAQPSGLWIDREPMHDRSGVLAALNNPATLADIQQAGFSVTHLRGYLLPDLDRTYISGVLPALTGTLAIGMMQTGNANFRQQFFQSFYSRKFSENVMAAMGPWLYIVQQSEGYGNKSTYGCTASLSCALGKQVRIHSVVDLPVTAKRDFYPSSRFRTGVVVRCSEVLKAEASGNISAGHPFQLSTGLFYQPQSSCFFRLGVNSRPFSFYSGAGFVCKKWTFDIAMMQQHFLGLSPRLSIAFSIDKKKGR
jgi:hypothetical protein